MSRFEIVEVCNHSVRGVNHYHIFDKELAEWICLANYATDEDLMGYLTLEDAQVRLAYLEGLNLPTAEKLELA